jgi:N-acetylneuraminic acid mutarotase
MPQPHTWHSASLLPDGTVLLAGGVNGDPDIGAGTIASDRARSLASADRYDPRTRSWSASTAMSQARALHAAVTLPDGRVLVFGGRNKGKTLDSIEIFDPGSGS